MVGPTVEFYLAVKTLYFDFLNPLTRLPPVTNRSYYYSYDTCELTHIFCSSISSIICLIGKKFPLSRSANLKAKQEVIGMSKRNLWKLSAIASICLMLAACGGGGDSSDGTGKLSVSITDAPIHDAQSVTVNFLGAEVKPADGPAVRFYFCENPADPERIRRSSEYQVCRHRHRYTRREHRPVEANCWCQCLTAGWC